LFREFEVSLFVIPYSPGFVILALMLIIDAHLDLSYNALTGQDVLRPARERKPTGPEIPTVGLPDLRDGGVGLICATIFTEPSINGSRGYRTADEAYVQGQQHLAWYQQQESVGHFRFIKSPSDLNGIEVPTSAQNAILLMEGADPLRTPADLEPWFAAGLRIVGLAWKQTRFAGGTGDPGPLTAAGVELIKALEATRIIHDTSHLAEESFWQLLHLTRGPVMASHSNCRAIVPTDRQLSDEMIKAIVARGGVIGINFFDRFLLPPDQQGRRRATLVDVVRHMQHICDLAGDARHVAIGTDMDGGLGRNEIPIEIETSADLSKLQQALSVAGFGDDDVVGIMGGNWLAFFKRSLPTG
jgi:membrane dipeptidase